MEQNQQSDGFQSMKNIFSAMENRIVVIYVSNGDKLLAKVHSLTKLGIIVKNPVILSFDSAQNLNFDLLFGGIEISEYHLMPATNIINFTLVFPYVERAYEKYIQETYRLRNEFLARVQTDESDNPLVNQQTSKTIH